MEWNRPTTTTWKIINIFQVKNRTALITVHLKFELTNQDSAGAGELSPDVKCMLIEVGDLFFFARDGIKLFTKKD